MNTLILLTIAIILTLVGIVIYSDNGDNDHWTLT